MSGLGSCRKCGVNVHWYQTSRHTTHPPLEKISGDTYVIHEQVVTPRNTYAMHSCRVIDRQVFDLHKEEVRHGVPPTLSTVNQRQVKARFWFAQVCIDLAERHQCPVCNAPELAPCEDSDWTYGHFSVPRFAAEPHPSRTELIAEGDMPKWISDVSFSYVSENAGEQVYADDVDGNFRVWR